MEKIKYEFPLPDGFVYNLDGIIPRLEILSATEDREVKDFPLQVMHEFNYSKALLIMAKEIKSLKEKYEAHKTT